MAGRRHGTVAVVSKVIVTGLIGLALTVSGCGGTGETKADFAALLKSVEGSQASASVYRPPDYTITDLLPGRRGDGSDSLVVGTVSSVTHGYGYALKDPPPEGGEIAVRVNYDDRAAQWRNLEVTIDVSETIAGPQMTSVTIPWAVLGNDHSGDDAEAAARALRRLGRVVVFTQKVPAHLASWDGLPRVAGDRSYNLGTIDEHDGLHFPFINVAEGPSEADWLGDTKTLDRLRAAAK
jgi:hypothetical protein